MPIQWTSTRDALTEAQRKLQPGPQKALGTQLLTQINDVGPRYSAEFPPNHGRGSTMTESPEHVAWRQSLTDFNELAAKIDGKPAPAIEASANGSTALEATRKRLKAIVDSSTHAQNPLRGLLEKAMGTLGTEPRYYVALHYTDAGQIEAKLQQLVTEAEAWLSVL